MDGELTDARACRACGARLARDQRYCVACGTRRGALPFSVAQALEAMVAETLDPVPHVAVEAEPAPKAERALQVAPVTLSRLPGPQALAAMLLGALAFGVLAGSIAPAPIQALASAPLSLVVHGAFGASHPRAAPLAADTGADTSATPTATQQTITVTTPAPSTSTPPSQTTPPATTTTPSGGGNGGGTGGGLLGLPPIHHVFLIVLSSQGYSQTFAATSGDRYLSHTLPRQGELIEDYYGVAGSSLANGEALISGQGPTALSLFNCPRYTPIAVTGSGTEGQVVGSGCVYPKRTLTIADELAKHGLTWKAYVDTIGAPCRHPLLGSTDPDFAPGQTDAYVTWRNPFVYFRSVTSKASCIENDVDLTRLAQDVRAPATTPAFSYIVPSPCEDGDATPCRPGAAAGLAPADAFLKRVVPAITRSAAYRDGGLIAITFDHAPQSGPNADANACCDTPAYPNVTVPPADSGTTTSTTSTPTTTTTPGTTGTTTTPVPPNPGDIPGQTTPTGGGGQVGLVLLSAYVKPGTVEAIDYYNHFSLLATIQSIFGLKRLGFAADRSLPVFDSVIFNRHPKPH